MGRRRSENLLTGAGSYARAVQSQQREADRGNVSEEWRPWRGKEPAHPTSAQFEQEGRVARREEDD